MSSNISITAPFLPRFTHSEGSLTTSWSQVLPASVTPEKRISLIVQNKDSAITVEVHLGPAANTANGGLNLAPGASISLDSYKGAVQARSASGTPILHIAYGIV